MRNCTNLIRCLPLLLHHPTRTGDAATQPHNITHAPDALRYFAVSRYGKSQSKTYNNVKLKEKLKIKRRTI